MDSLSKKILHYINSLALDCRSVFGCRHKCPARPKAPFAPSHPSSQGTSLPYSNERCGTGNEQILKKKHWLNKSISYIICTSTVYLSIFIYSSIHLYLEMFLLPVTQVTKRIATVQIHGAWPTPHCLWTDGLPVRLCYWSTWRGVFLHPYTL